MWNVEQVKPIYHFQLASGSTPALSPDRKHLFYAQRTSIGVLDVDKGEVLASRKFHGIVWSALRYSPAGDRVACLSHKRLLIFDFASGQTMLNVPKPTSFGKGAFCFVGDHLLVGTRLLYDIKNQLVSWYYEGATGAIELGDHCCFVYNGRQKAAGMVLPERIPHAAVFDAIDKAMLDPEFWVLAKGTTVKVDVSGVSDDNRREQLASSLAKRLTEKGFGVGDDGTITLQANVFNPVEEEVTYNDSPALFDRSGTSAKILKYTSGLKFVYGKETAWESYGSNVPSMLSQRSGESIQDALKRHEKPNYMWFDQVELPNLLRKPGTNSALGMTTISNAGLQEK